MDNHFNQIVSQLKRYHVTYWRNRLLLALIKSIIWLFSFSLLFIFLEYVAWFSIAIREFLFYLFLLLSFFTFLFFLYKPVFELLRKLKQQDFLNLALEVGSFLPKGHSDELINYLQLNEQRATQKNDLIFAAIAQKEAQLLPISLADFASKEFLKFPFYVFLGLMFFFSLGQLLLPSLFQKPAIRIWNFTSHYSKEIPFDFIVLNNPLQAIAGEETEVRLTLKGKNVPNEVFILVNGEKIPMKLGKIPHTFSVLLAPIQKAIQIQFEADSYYSEPINLDLIHRPGVQQVKMLLQFPAYLKKENEEVFQVSELKVPEGTRVTWDMVSSHADRLGILFSHDQAIQWANHFPFSSIFHVSKQLVHSGFYQIIASNSNLSLQKSLEQAIEIIPDRKPQVKLDVIEDTLYYRFKVLKLQVGDDYGISRMNLHLNIIRKGDLTSITVSRPISYPRGIPTFHTDFIWRTDSLNLKPGDQVRYYVDVYDNDGFHGPKMGRTDWINWEFPSMQKLSMMTNEKVDKIEDQVKKSIEKAQELKQEITEMNRRVLLGKDINEQAIKELSMKEQALKKALQDLKNLNDQWMGQQMSFQKMDPNWQQKMENLQKLIQELWKPDMDKQKDDMFNEFEKENPSLWKSHLDQMKKQGKSVENELKRLEKFYQELKVQKMVQDAVDDLRNLAKEQAELAQKNEGSKEIEKQNELNDKFEQERNDISEVEKEQNEMKGEKSMDTEKEIQEEIKVLMEEAKENLSKNSAKKAQEKQKKASEKLQKLADQLESQMDSQEAMELDVDVAKLRLLMEDLLQISFEQERLLKVFRRSSLEDLSLRKSIQDQIKLGETVHLMEDSLQSLAKRLLPVSQVIINEGATLRQKMDETSKLLKERKWSLVLYRQQEGMAASNQLAVLLSNLLKQMENQQMQSKPGKKKGKSQSAKGDWGKRQQKLNDKMKSMKNAGSNVSNEELMKLAEEQYRIRQEIEQKIQDIKGLPGLKDLQKNLEDLAKDLDKNETEMVNKRLNNLLPNKQDQLLPRLMEVEKALKEQGEDTKRASKSAIQQWRENPPPNLLPYLKKQAINKDLYQQIPVDLLPKYQEKVLKFLKK